jgi:hypothetical protein
VDAGAKEVTVKDLASGEPLVIRVTADSHVKRMLDREAMIAMMHGSSQGSAAGHGAGDGAMHAPLMSLNEMLERLPEAKLEDRDVVVVSSTKVRRRPGDGDLYAGECGDMTGDGVAAGWCQPAGAGMSGSPSIDRDGFRRDAVRGRFWPQMNTDEHR